jgi:prepilin-type N-terminal cleavage/methylation domain-containing protein
MKIFKSNRGGFTLIELLVVIAIISLLSSVILAALNSARDKAKGSKFRQEVYQLINAIELYRNDNNGGMPLNYVLSGAWGQFIISSSGTLNSAPISNNTRTPADLLTYINKIPTPPFSDSSGFDYLIIADYTDKNSNSSKCVGDTIGSKYIILIGGDKNKEFFQDWPNYTALPTRYKCFSIK